MSGLKGYAVEIGGLPHTLLLSDADAEARGLKPVETKQSDPPANKARTPQNKSGGN